MWPAATWIVVGVVMRRSHVETALAAGVAALPRQRMRRPAGVNAASGPYFRARSNSASLRSQSCALLALRAGELDGAGQEHRSGAASSLADAGATVSSGARAIGRAAVEQVVVHLHHDLASGRKRDAGALGEAVPAPARRPGGDPVRVVRASRRSPLRRLPEARSHRSTTSPGRRRRRRAACASASWVRRGRGRGSRGARSSADRGRSAPTSRTSRPPAWGRAGSSGSRR